MRERSERRHRETVRLNGNPPNGGPPSQLEPPAGRIVGCFRRRVGWLSYDERRALGVPCPICGRPAGMPCGKVPWRHGLAHVERLEADTRRRAEAS